MSETERQRMKVLMAYLLILTVSPCIVLAKRRRVPFMNCQSSKSNSGLIMTKPARSRIECSVICLNDPDCLSASYCKTNDGYTCQLSGFYAEGSCSGLAMNDDCTQTSVMDPCENGGTFFPQNRSCLCVKGFLGDYCQRYPRDCMETSLENQIYTIQPLGSLNSFQWACDTPATNYTLLTYFLSSMTVNHTQPWHDMKHGILPSIPPTQYFFIGLENVHQLTKQGWYDMFVALYPKGKPFGKLWYRNFRVTSESEGYAWHWDSFEADTNPFANSADYLDGFGGAGDTTKNLNGQRFGTHDNDISGCALAKNAAWWYNHQGCTVLIFEPNGVSWPTVRSGTFDIEYIDIVIIGLTPVYWYVNDDLVLE